MSKENFDSSRFLPDALELSDNLDTLIYFSEFLNYPSKKEYKKAVKRIRKMRKLIEAGKSYKLFRKEIVSSFDE